MAKKQILSNHDEWKVIIEQQKSEFVFWILESMGLPQDDLSKCFTLENGTVTNEAVTVQHRIELKKLCSRYEIDIIDDMDGGVKIYINNESLVAEWKKPSIRLRHDHNRINPAERLYMEINIDWWTIFEGSDDK